MPDWLLIRPQMDHLAAEDSLDTPLFDTSLERCKTYSTLLQLLRVFRKHISVVPASVQSMQGQWAKTYQGRYSDRLERFDPGTQEALLDNWEKVAIHLDKIHDRLLQRIQGLEEEVKSLRDGVSTLWDLFVDVANSAVGFSIYFSGVVYSQPANKPWCFDSCSSVRRFTSLMFYSCKFCVLRSVVLSRSCLGSLISSLLTCNAFKVFGLRLDEGYRGLRFFYLLVAFITLTTCSSSGYVLWRTCSNEARAALFSATFKSGS